MKYLTGLIFVASIIVLSVCPGYAQSGNIAAYEKLSGTLSVDIVEEEDADFKERFLKWISVKSWRMGELSDIVGRKLQHMKRESDIQTSAQVFDAAVEPDAGIKDVKAIYTSQSKEMEETYASEIQEAKRDLAERLGITEEEIEFSYISEIMNTGGMWPGWGNVLTYEWPGVSIFLMHEGERYEYRCNRDGSDLTLDPTIFPRREEAIEAAREALYEFLGQTVPIEVVEAIKDLSGVWTVILGVDNRGNQEKYTLREKYVLNDVTGEFKVYKSIREKHYPDGRFISREEKEYDVNENMVKSFHIYVEYVNGICVREVINIKTYVDGACVNYIFDDKTFTENGEFIRHYIFTWDWDSEGNLVYTRCVYYDADGEIIRWYEYNYTYNENGQLISYELNHYRGEELSSTRIVRYEYDDEGRRSLEEIEDYNADGTLMRSVRYEWEYEQMNPTGYKIRKYKYVPDILVSVTHWYYNDDDTLRSLSIQTLEYHDNGEVKRDKWETTYYDEGDFNGTQMFDYWYNEKGNWTKVICENYDKDGNMQRYGESIFEYYDDGETYRETNSEETWYAPDGEINSREIEIFKYNESGQCVYYYKLRYNAAPYGYNNIVYVDIWKAEYYEDTGVVKRIELSRYDDGLFIEGYIRTYNSEGNLSTYDRRECEYYDDGVLKLDKHRARNKENSVWQNGYVEILRYNEQGDILEKEYEDFIYINGARIIEHAYNINYEYSPVTDNLINEVKRTYDAGRLTILNEKIYDEDTGELISDRTYDVLEIEVTAHLISEGVIDLDGDGWLTVADYAMAGRAYIFAQKFPDDLTDDMKEQLDQNGDGEVTGDDFRLWFEGYIQARQEINQVSQFAYKLSKDNFDLNGDGMIDMLDYDTGVQLYNCAVKHWDYLEDFAKENIDQNGNGMLDEEDTIILTEKFNQVKEDFDEIVTLAEHLANNDFNMYEDEYISLRDYCVMARGYLRALKYWDSLPDDIKDVIDQNGDGQLDVEDGMIMIEKMRKVWGTKVEVEHSKPEIPLQETETADITQSYKEPAGPGAAELLQKKAVEETVQQQSNDTRFSQEMAEEGQVVPLKKKSSF